MRLAVPLHLGDLIERLPAGAGLGVALVEFLAEGLDHREHRAVAQVAVVGDREHLAAGLLLRGRHPLPEVLGVVVAERRQRGVGLDEARLRAVPAEDDVAVQVVAAGVHGPLVADEGREPARVVVGLGRLDRLLPGRAVGLGARGREALGHLARAEALDDVERGLHALSGVNQVVPFLALLRPQQGRVAAHQQREEAHAVRVVGDHEEVERPRELHRLPGRRRDLLAPGEAVGVARRQPRTGRAGVHRERGVQVRVAEERPRWEIAARVRRVRRLRRQDPLEARLRDDSGVTFAEFLIGSDGRQRETADHAGGQQAGAEHSSHHRRFPLCS